MTREKAINILAASDYFWLRPSKNEAEALNMSIESLKKQSPCDMCEHLKEDCWEMCQFCPAEPKRSNEE